MHSLFSTVFTAALLLSSASAQTFTKCNPLKKHCPSDHGLDKKHWEVDFVKHGASAMKDWKVTAGTISHGPKGAGFSIKKRGDAPTMQTKFNIFFGHVECTMLAAPGQGVISSFILESDDLDEIDWEFVGSDTGTGQSNFFGKGNTTTYDRGAYHPVQGPQLSRHTYAVDWTKDRIQWIINGKVVRTVPFHDALALHGRNYPQTPMTVRLGVWAGGDPSNSPGTIQWAGGPINYGAGPYTMHVEKVKITNYNPAKGYKYGNRSGSYKSIKKLHNSPRAEDAAEVGSNHPQMPNRRPGPAISYSVPATTSAPTPSYVPYSSTHAPYPIGNSTAPHSTGGYHPGTSTIGGGSSTGTSTSTPTAAANAVHAKVGGAIAGVLGVVALL